MKRFPSVSVSVSVSASVRGLPRKDSKWLGKRETGDDFRTATVPTPSARRYPGLGEGRRQEARSAGCDGESAMSDEIEERMIGARNEMLATVWLLNQGYQVFRNVSAHGPIDIIGLKNGKFEHFDVKMAYTHKSRQAASRPRIKQEQKELNVKILRVYDNGICDIDENPPLIGDPARIALFGSRNCTRCGEAFEATHHRQTRCAKDCGAAT
jgi:Holliday junction resolvase-like predicted endonuclease